MVLGGSMVLDGSMVLGSHRLEYEAAETALEVYIHSSSSNTFALYHLTTCDLVTQANLT